MKKLYISFLVIFITSLLVYDASAQFVVAQDTIRGRINFCARPGDLSNMEIVPNDSVFYMYPPDLEIDPWRRVDFYTPSRTIKKGYIKGTNLMRVDDYELIEDSHLSAHGMVSFKNSKIRVQIAIAKVTGKETYLKQGTDKMYYVQNKPVKGVAKGDTPKIRYQSISATIKGRNITFPANRFNFLLEPEIDNIAVYYNEAKDIVYIIANNGGTDAFYTVLWQVTPKGVSSPYVFDPSIKL